MTVKFKESIEFEEMKHDQLVVQVWGVMHYECL